MRIACLVETCVVGRYANLGVIRMPRSIQILAKH